METERANAARKAALDAAVALAAAQRDAAKAAEEEDGRTAAAAAGSAELAAHAAAEVKQSGKMEISTSAAKAPIGPKASASPAAASAARAPRAAVAVASAPALAAPAPAAPAPAAAAERASAATVAPAVEHAASDVAIGTGAATLSTASAPAAAARAAAAPAAGAYRAALPAGVFAVPAAARRRRSGDPVKCGAVSRTPSSVAAAAFVGAAVAGGLAGAAHTSLVSSAGASASALRAAKRANAVAADDAEVAKPDHEIKNGYEIYRKREYLITRLIGAPWKLRRVSLTEPVMQIYMPGLDVSEIDKDRCWGEPQAPDINLNFGGLKAFIWIWQGHEGSIATGLDLKRCALFLAQPDAFFEDVGRMYVRRPGGQDVCDTELLVDVFASGSITPVEVFYAGLGGGDADDDPMDGLDSLFAASPPVHDHETKKARVAEAAGGGDDEGIPAGWRSPEPHGPSSEEERKAKRSAERCTKTALRQQAARAAGHTDSGAGAMESAAAADADADAVAPKALHFTAVAGGADAAGADAEAPEFVALMDQWAALIHQVQNAQDVFANLRGEFVKPSVVGGHCAQLKLHDKCREAQIAHGFAKDALKEFEKRVENRLRAMDQDMLKVWFRGATRRCA